LLTCAFVGCTTYWFTLVVLFRICYKVTSQLVLYPLLVPRLFSVVHRGTLDYVRTEFFCFRNITGYKYRLLNIGALYLVTRLSFVRKFCTSFWKPSKHRNKTFNLPCTCYYSYSEKTRVEYYFLGQCYSLFTWSTLSCYLGGVASIQTNGKFIQ
jgi:hypothetical protein